MGQRTAHQPLSLALVELGGMSNEVANHRSIMGCVGGEVPV
jgi:hypothetical protein